MNNAQRKQVSIIHAAVQLAHSTMVSAAEEYSTTAETEEYDHNNGAHREAKTAFVVDAKESLSRADEVSRLEELASEEEEKYDNMPESLQSGEKGEALQEAQERLETAASELGDAVQSVETALNDIDNAEDDDTRADALTALTEALEELDAAADAVYEAAQ